MRYFLLINVLFPLFAFAQSGKRDVLNPLQLSLIEYNLIATPPEVPNVRLPFARIKIIDSRFDTSKLGYLLLKVGMNKRKAFSKIGFKGGVQKALENYYNDRFKASFTQNDFELLIVMKSFWLSTVDSRKNKRVELARQVTKDCYLHSKWEYYIGKEGLYLPVKRMDTVFRLAKGFEFLVEAEFNNRERSFVSSSLNSMVEILDFSNAIIQFKDQPKKSLNEISEYNNKRNLLPVLQDQNFKRGIYFSFEEFKNNKPSIEDFVEKKMRYGLANSEIYLEDMKGETIGQYWGYSDGAKFRYGMLGNDKIYRIQNTFCFFIKVVGYIVNSGSDTFSNEGDYSKISKDKYEIWVPYQINMETGEIY